jgi:3-oxoacyl-(acyl-carrier-protein) synthase III
MIPVRILGTAAVFPGRLVTTAEVAARAVPPLDPAVIEAKTGIKTRWFAEPGTMLSDLAARALRAAAEAAGIDVRDLRRVILTTTVGGDVIGPATVNATIHALGLDGRCDGFDLLNACTGFLSALDVGARSVATGIHPVGIVSAELSSRIIRPEEHRGWVLFGDAAAAAVLGPGRPGEGLAGMYLGNEGRLSRTVYVEHPLISREMEWVKMDLRARDVVELIVPALQKSAAAVLGGESIASVDWVLPHQPNGLMLDTLVGALGIPREKIVPVVADIGSVISASIPASLDRLLRTRPVRPGDRILMIAVGSGVSYGAALYRVAPEP